MTFWRLYVHKFRVQVYRILHDSHIPTRYPNLASPKSNILSTGLGKCGNVTYVGRQVTLCDPIWHVNSRSGEACLRIAIFRLGLLLVYFYMFRNLEGIGLREFKRDVPLK